MYETDTYEVTYCIASACTNKHEDHFSEQGERIEGRMGGQGKGKVGERPRRLDALLLDRGKHVRREC